MLNEPRYSCGSRCQPDKQYKAGGVATEVAITKLLPNAARLIEIIILFNRVCIVDRLLAEFADDAVLSPRIQTS